MAKSFIDVVQDSPRTGLGIPVKTGFKEDERISVSWQSDGHRLLGFL